MSIYNDRHKAYTKQYVKDKYARVSIYFSRAEKQKLVDYCEDRDLTVSSFIKSVVMDELKKAGY